MTEALSDEAFNALHPFSFETDTSGIIIRAGRSLHKLSPEVKTSTQWRDVFDVVDANLLVNCATFESLRGEVICLVHKRDQRVRLRGQVVRLGVSPERYLFSIHPALWEAHQLSELGLDITDFEIGTAVFDFILYSQAHAEAREKTRTALRRLEWDTTIARLLYQVTRDTESASTLREAYRIMVESVCRCLEWEVGHVLERVDDKGEYLVSSGIWCVSDEQAYRDLRATSEGCFFSVREGLTAKVLETGGIVWLQDAASEEIFRRRKTLEKLSPVSVIAIPVRVRGEVQAIVEFFTRKNALEHEVSYRFCELLAIQLSAVIERVERQRVERERLALLAQSAKMATLGEIATGIAHEINNPVSTISLVGHIIKRLAQKGEVSQEDLAPQLQRLELCVKRIAKIVSELRAFSREAPKDGFELTSLKTLVEETLDLCHARFAQGSITVRVLDIPPTWSAECRSSQISQVLLNLLSNAYDAVVCMNPAWIEVSVADKGKDFEIAITDSGMGISDDVAESMMKPFFTTKPIGKGTGLGLSISSNIMTDHRGSIELDRSSAHTRFVVRLPKSQPSDHGQKLRAVC